MEVRQANPSEVSSVPPTPVPVSKPRHRPSPAHFFQARAFIQATESVDADADVIEDILDGLDGLEDDNESEQDSEPPEPLEVELKNAADLLDVLEEDSEGLETNPLSEFEEAAEAWTQEEVDQMLDDLRQHGRSYFIQEYVVKRAIPIPTLLYVFDLVLCKELRAKRPKTLLYFLEVVITRVLESRQKLSAYNTINDVVELIKKCQSIVILTGAGISVSCGIPDFRSRDGLYASLQNSGEYFLDDPQQMFDIHYFKENPAVFYSFAKKLYPSNFTPSPCHRFIRLIEEKGRLLRNYTQNIDTLETRAGVEEVLQCHGSFATASCVNCRARYPGNFIEDDIMNQRVPLCKQCPPPPQAPPPRAKSQNKKKGKKKPWESDGDDDEPDLPAYPPGIIKPDITFFGEKLSDEFENALHHDITRVNLLLVIGTSLKVSPVSEILTHMPHRVPQVVINKTPIRHINPDVVLLGDADVIVQHLAGRLGWDLPELPSQNLDAAQQKPRKRPIGDIDREPRRVGNSHVWLFEGAEGGKWVEALESQSQEVLPPDFDSGQTHNPPNKESQTAKKARTG